MTECWLCPVKHDRTCPVRKNRVWNLTGNDRTLAGCVRSVLTYADVGRTEETLSDRTLGESGRA